MKKLIAILSGLMIATLSWAQDIIVCKDSKRIDAKIIEVSQEEIKYKKFDFQDGPTFSLKTNEISSIIYSNGEVAAFNAQPSPAETTSSSANPPSTPKKKRELNIPNPKSKQRPVGIAIGYMQKSLIYNDIVWVDGLPTNNTKKVKRGLTNSFLQEYAYEDIPEKKFSNTVFIGLTWAPEFGYGFGLQTGLYYELTMEQVEYEDLRYQHFADEHALSLPLRFQYRIEVAKDFSLFLYTGPSFDYSLAFNIREKELPNPGSLIKPKVEKYNLYEEYDLKRFNVMWGVGGGLRWKGLQLRAGGDWGLINMMKGGDSNNKYLLHKPFYIALSYQF